MYKTIALLGLIGCLQGAQCFADADDDDKSASASKPVHTTIQATSQPEAIDLDTNIQQLAGIKTQTLRVVQQQPEFTAYGTVLNLESLLQLHQQYLAASAQQEGAQAKFNEAHHNLSRTENLHQQDIVSTHRLQEQQAQWQTDKASLNASQYLQQTIRASSRLEWGDTLTNWFVLGQDKIIKPFLSQQAQLLQITLPVGANLSPQTQTIYVDPRGQRDTAIKATFIASSPKIDPVTMGQRYFFKTEGQPIPFGAHVTAWIANDNTAVTGVVIPKSAIVWHLGQAFVFIKSAGQQFDRLPLPLYMTHADGYFVKGDALEGHEIVVSGAQTLLSQQLKALIPREDDD